MWTPEAPEIRKKVASFLKVVALRNQRPQCLMMAEQFLGADEHKGHGTVVCAHRCQLLLEEKTSPKAVHIYNSGLVAPSTVSQLKNFT